MNKGSLVPLLYGYIVCIISVIVTLISVSMIVNAVFSLQDPLRSNSNRYYGPSADLSSYEAYKIDIRSRSTYPEKALTPDQSAQQYVPTDDELRAAYESSKAEHIAGVRLDATKTITNGIILLLIAAGLFFSHWRWLADFR